MKLVMTLLVRDEDDILALNLEHHLAQGIDRFIVTDNRSRDSTPQILRRYAERGLLEIIEEPGETYDQARWVTRMAERAAASGADWVIHCDADEFWIARQPGCRLRDQVMALPADQPVQIVQRWNAAIDDQHHWQDWIDPLTVDWFDTASENAHGHPLPPKVLHRARPGVRIAQGNHSLSWPEPNVPSRENHELVILHFPFRGYRHYATKIEQGGRSYSANAELHQAMGGVWRSDYLQWMAGRLQPLCRERLPSAAVLTSWREQGRLQPAPNRLPAAVPRGLAQPRAAERDADEGVICLADDNYFFGVRLLYHSLDQQRPLTVYDLGLSEESRRWVARHPEITIRPIPETSLVQAIRQDCGERSLAKATKREWPLWICPDLILDAPYRRVAWIDADAIVLRGLQGLFRRIAQAPFITRENLAPEQTANPPELLHQLPLASGEPAEDILLNAGVSGWCLERDRALLEGYTHPIRCIFQGRTLVRDAVRWHDQGCLIWALQNAGYDSSVLRAKRWNLCVKHSALMGLRIDATSSDDAIRLWLEQARSLEQRAKIVHWNGHPVPWT